MPTGSPQEISMMPGQISVPADGLFISVSVQSDGTPASLAALPNVLQDIVDLFQGWSGRLPGADVTGQLYGTTLAAVTPTNPVPPPLPPEEEPEVLAGDESPSEVV